MAKSRNAARQRGQWNLIGILVSLVVIMILSAWYYKSVLSPKPGSHNGAPAAEQSAYGSVCSEYQAQLNQSAMMYRQDHNDRNPTSFEDLKKEGATDEIIKAPGCQFQLDPATGTVTDIGKGMAAPGAAPMVLGGGNSAPEGSSPASSRSAPGPGGVTLPPSSSSVPANGGGGDGAE